MNQENMEVTREEVTKNTSRKKKKTGHVGAIIVCLFYLVLIVVFGVFLDKGLKWLEGWLTDYEAAQPNVKSQQVFDELFAHPDWAVLYEMAGVEDTEFESARHYAAYMEEKVGDSQLQYFETSAGLSGDHKYIVKLENEKVAEYTLTAEEHEVTDIPDWQLGTVNVFFERRQDVTVCADPDRKICINGVELTDDYTVGTMDTDVEGYLPEGLHGLRRRWVYADGLLVHPEVTATDASGAAVTLIYDEATNTYSEPIPEMTISKEQADTVVNAAKAYCRYMIGAGSRTALRNCYDTSTEIYRIITTNETWMQDYRSYHFGEYFISDYYCYSDTLYSAKLTMSLFVTRMGGSEKEYPLDSTFIMAQNEEGVWKVLDMINVDVQQQTTLVRLRYMVDGEVLQDQMVDINDTVLTPPAVTAPEGKTFAGWYLQQTDERGNTTYSLAFTPDENGNVYLSGPLGQEPMVLYALFENA